MSLTSCLSLVPVANQYGWSQPALRCGGGEFESLGVVQRGRNTPFSKNLPGHRGCCAMMLNHIAQHTNGLQTSYLSIGL
jgi:hypothetical protein